MSLPPAWRLAIILTAIVIIIAVAYGLTAPTPAADIQLPTL